MLRFLGEHKAFMADVNIGTKSERGGTVLLSGKLAFHDGQSRLELDLTKMEAGRMPPAVMESSKPPAWVNLSSSPARRRS